MSESNKPNDGGLAFPRTGADGHTSPQSGMTLRDYFAAKCIPILVSEILRGNLRPMEEGKPINESLVSGQAYAFADAMIAERKKGAK